MIRVRMVCPVFCLPGFLFARFYVCLVLCLLVFCLPGFLFVCFFAFLSVCIFLSTYHCFIILWTVCFYFYYSIITTIKHASLIIPDFSVQTRRCKVYPPEYQPVPVHPSHLRLRRPRQGRHHPALRQLPGHRERFVDNSVYFAFIVFF